jgi:hypothetical protein
MNENILTDKCIIASRLAKLFAKNLKKDEINFSIYKKLFDSCNIQIKVK